MPAQIFTGSRSAWVSFRGSMCANLAIIENDRTVIAIPIA